MDKEHYLWPLKKRTGQRTTAGETAGEILACGHVVRYQHTNADRRRCEQCYKSKQSRKIVNET